MSCLLSIYRRKKILSFTNTKYLRYNTTSTPEVSWKKDEEEEFRVLNIVKTRQRVQRKSARRDDVQPDRSERMAPDQNWGNVWPGPKSFHPSSVPLPLRQGYVPQGQAPPGKKANAELMKIPNFLHLTPPVIKTQCEALKKFCTKWPKLLNSEQSVENHYPVEVITSDYCHASPSIRNPLARIVILRIKLSQLNLDKHSKDKFLRLVGDKHDKTTDLITLTADRCPARKQNYDYVHYLLTACYHEAWNVEEWEKDKTEDDMEYYDFDNNTSKRNLVNWYQTVNNEVKELSDQDYKDFDVSLIENGTEYKDSVSSIFNDGENAETLKKYNLAVRKLLGLPEKCVESSINTPL